MLLWDSRGAFGGAAKVIAYIEDPVVIKKILTHLEDKTPTISGPQLPDTRAPPQAASPFD